MSDTLTPLKQLPENTKFLLIALIILTGLVYYFSNPAPQAHYDYTFRVADNILRGSIALNERPPSWLNEFVPFEGYYYTVFPLGGIVTMMPFALLKLFGIIKGMPAAFIAGLTASGICLFLLLIAMRYEISRGKQALMAMGMLFGTWMWTNMTMGGAWQLALGFAMLGELGAIYFAVYNRKPFLAGLFFAMAFGNRTEVLLTAPILMLLLVKPDLMKPAAEAPKKKGKKKNAGQPADDNAPMELRFSTEAVLKNWKAIAAFCAIPFILGVATLVYNYIRFHSFTDFGYARIPGVLAEPWYNHGIFSLYYIPGQAWEMLIKPWEAFSSFPYLKPNPFSSSIIWSSPFLLLTARFGSRDKVLKYLSWAAIVILTFLLWMHGNSGGWQFGYRYAMVLLPWAFVILLESTPKKITTFEWGTYLFSFAVNIYATWLFHWTTYLKP